jgi:hypothetical protein
MSDIVPFVTATTGAPSFDLLAGTKELWGHRATVSESNSRLAGAASSLLGSPALNMKLLQSRCDDFGGEQITRFIPMAIAGQKGLLIVARHFFGHIDHIDICTSSKLNNDTSTNNKTFFITRTTPKPVARGSANKQ